MSVPVFYNRRVTFGSAFFRKKTILVIAALCVAGLAVSAWFVFSRPPSPSPVSPEEMPELAELNPSWTPEEYRNFFVSLAEKKTAVYAFQVLKYADIPEGVDVHKLGHSIGYVHYDQKGLKGIYDCTTDFRNACEHAIVVQALIVSGTKAFEDVAKVCSEGPGGITAYVHCFHGIGHGLMAYFDYDYEESVAACRKVYDFAITYNPEVTTSDMWHECVGGATMELTQGEHDQNAWLAAKKIYMPDSDILMPCDAPFLPDEVRPMCYSYIKPRFLEAAGAVRGTPSPDAYPAALAYCGLIPADEPQSRDGCYAGFGAIFAYFASGDARTLEHMTEEELQNVHEWCGYIGDERDRSVCSLSALDVIFWGGQSDSPASIAFCSLAPDEYLRSRCFTALGEMARYSFESRPRALEFCARFPEAYRNECINTAP